MVMKKKGISTVVATVLIILLTVAAVAILWVAVIPMIKEKLAFSGLSGGVSVVTSEGYTVYDPEKKIATVQVKGSPGKAKIGNIKIIFSFAGDSYSSIIPAPKSGQ